MPNSGDVLTTIEYSEYELGGYEADQTATPSARFGPSFSCPFLMLPPQVFSVDDSLPGDSIADCCGCECHPPNATGPTLPSEFGPTNLLAAPYWTSLGHVGGLPQIASDESYSETWAP